MAGPYDLVREFCEWGKHVAPHTRWWIDDDVWEVLATALDLVAGPITYESCLIPVFKITWRGSISLYRRSHYAMTRVPDAR